VADASSDLETRVAVLEIFADSTDNLEARVATLEELVRNLRLAVNGAGVLLSQVRRDLQDEDR
jgi:hypothetical protein